VNNAQAGEVAIFSTEGTVEETAVKMDAILTPSNPAPGSQIPNIVN